MSEETIFGRPMSALEYAENWAKEADVLAASGEYAWLASELGTPARALEIGCGNGASTQSLVLAGAKVVSLEVNEELTHRARERLQGAGIDCELVSTESSLQPDGATVRIVLGNALTLADSANVTTQGFDAVVCWFVGAQPAIISEAMKKPIVQFEGSETRDYRVHMQQQAYRLADICLKPGGRIQIADRLQIGSWNEKDSVRRELARVHSEWAGEGFVVDPAMTRLRKLPKDYGRSQIQHRSENGEATQGLRVVTSVIGVRQP